MTKDEALKLALSTLDEVRQETFRLMRDGQKLYAEKKVWEAIYTIKKVLAQEQEPVAWEQFYPDIGKPQIAFNAEVIGYVAPQQEPVAWGVFEANLHDMFFTEAEAVEMSQLKGNHAEVKPLYAYPPQRKPLTKDEICAIGGIVAHGDVFFINIKQLNQLVGIKE